MKVIYTRTMRVKDDGLGKAMEIGKGLAAVRKKHYPNHDVYFLSLIHISEPTRPY